MKRERDNILSLFLFILGYSFATHLSTIFMLKRIGQVKLGSSTWRLYDLRNDKTNRP